MAPTRYKSILALEENSPEVFMESTEVLLKISGNILKEPGNPKFRSISLGSKIVMNKLLPASGAMECLFEMGFQEGVDKLIFPQAAPLESLKQIHNELLRRRFQRASVKKHTEPVESPKKSGTDERILLVANDLLELSTQTSHSFLKKIIFWCYYVLKYENHDLQLKALKLVPIEMLNLNVMKNIRKIQLELKKKKISNEVMDCQELLLMEVVNWFKNEFFSWVDTPPCTKCGFKETVNVGMSTEKFEGADRVEEYKCPKCSEKVLFPRYNDPEKLLHTRRGRCGEWANCFCLFARSLGWDARLVVDETDHVWTEVYSVIKSKWLHCDPCENVVDTPLMYEHGWKKQLSYVIAYSKDEIQDVTWRYSGNHSKVLGNRNKCTEQELVEFIVKLRNLLLSRASVARRNFVVKRTALELVELMKENSASEAEEKGRTSGSLAWRLSRGETALEDDFQAYVWKVEPQSEGNKQFVLSYTTSKDHYSRNSKPVLRTWKDGLYSMKSIFRKVEKDWKMTYLVRRENSDRGVISWKFETDGNFVIETVDLKLVRKTFESGKILCKMCSNDTCVLVPDESFVTDAFKGSRTVELIVELFGGNGSNSWQHAQILRQPLDSNEPTFTITLNLVQA